MTLPLMDLRAWTDGTDARRRAFAAEVDDALQTSGFLLLSGHGIPVGWRAELREAAARAFALPDDVRARYATQVGGRGWIPPGKEANSFYGEESDPDRADMKESWVTGPAVGTGDPAVDAEWFPPNVWPDEVPELEACALRYTTALDHLYAELIRVCASALGLEPDWFVDRTRRGVRSLNINRYPALREVGPALDGQFRIAPHTDWGTLTILDRQPGYGGLQLQAPNGEWQDAPFVDDAFTINVGDLLARWTGDRWRSTRHRVLPPPVDVPDEALTSLIAFFEADPDVLVEPFGPPIGRHDDYEPVLAGDWLLSRYAATRV
ncbi:MAG: 2OG-Fe(II) oxygenase [Actinomycetia bacterium]|nr:2OG-Fe(II) oxygenase [Actinomycetes bacterium]